MKIYFTCSTAKFKKYRDNYYAIRKFLVDNDHILTRDWMGKAERRMDSGEEVIKDIKDIYDSCINALYEADLVIIEDTVSNFSTGHQITVALQRQKPTLVLWLGEKHRHFQTMFIHGIESEYLEVAEYTMDNYQEIITAFINKYEDAKVKNRFHLVLNNVERSYLDWAQFNKNTSRTQLIRKALQKEIEGDESYTDYLTGKGS